MYVFIYIIYYNHYLPQKQTSVMLEKEESLQARIKEHATKLREYHNQTNSQLANHDTDIHDERMKSEYRFTAFTGDLI